MEMKSGLMMYVGGGRDMGYKMGVSGSIVSKKAASLSWDNLHGPVWNSVAKVLLFYSIQIKTKN